MLRAKPFQPFPISMSDGQQYEIRHPEIAIVSRSTVLVGIPCPSGKREKSFFGPGRTVMIVEVGAV
jgi:hypothetical protein